MALERSGPPDQRFRNGVTRGSRLELPLRVSLGANSQSRFALDVTALAVANRIATARGESRTLVSTWCDSKEGNCARCSCPRNGKIACGKPSRITR
jgi:hypothetical protein